MRWFAVKFSFYLFICFVGNKVDREQYQCEAQQTSHQCRHHVRLDGREQTTVNCFRRFMDNSLYTITTHIEQYRICEIEQYVLFILGNIDQIQYCEKIKNIVDFLGTKLSNEELTKIWHMQVLYLTLLIRLRYIL